MRSCFKIPDGYKNVFADIHMQCEIICDQEKKLAETIQRQQVLEQERQQEQQNRMDELAAQIKKVQTYLVFATSKLEEFHPDEAKIVERPYNTVVLQQLLMKMNMGIRTGYAEQLYFEAMGQQRGLESRQRCLSRNASSAAADYPVQEFIRDQNSRFDAVFRNFQNSGGFGTNSLEQGIRNNVPAMRDGRAHGDNAAMLTVPLPRPQHAASYRFDIYPFSFQDYTISFPLEFDLTRGSCTFIGYNRETRDQVNDFLERLAVHAAINLKGQLDQLLFVDPFRMNSDVLSGFVTEAGKDEQCIIMTPVNREGIRNAIQKLLSDCTALDRINARPYRMCILRGFPDEYDAETQAMIRQLCFNAEEYSVIMILLKNFREQNMPKDYSLPFDVEMISVSEKGLCLPLPFASAMAKVRFFGPEQSEKQDASFIREEKKEQLDNNYCSCLQRLDGQKFDGTFRYLRKGQKELQNLSYAVTTDGAKLLKTSMEGIETFGFVYGATRSGKSTFLHTLITSVMLTMHPDDVEIWLVDFKMTEFNRYIGCLPPHVRYIMLEDSPEMVEDLINRLMEVYQKRQRDRFSPRKWTAMKDVPKDEYITSVFVIIDEFNVMSSILNQDGEEDYRADMEFLITKAAAFGIHILFSSQNFSSGLGGLSTTAKGNIGWRAALWGTADEKNETLALGARTERDSLLISTLERFHVLVRRQTDSQGNQLDHGKVLFPSAPEQERLIKMVRNAVHTCEIFDPDDTGKYISKKPEIYDGRSYKSFEDHRMQMRALKNACEQGDDRIIALYPGQPRRMRIVQPVEMRPFIGENLLIVGNPRQTDDMVSLILSLIESGTDQMNDCEVDILLAGTYQPFVSAADLAGKKAAVYRDVQDMKNCLRRIIQSIEQGCLMKTLILIPDLLEHNQRKDDNDEHKQWKTDDDESVAGDWDDENLPETVEDVQKWFEEDAAGEDSDKIPTDKEDTSLSSMADWLLRNGPKNGCHIISILKSSYELANADINRDLYRHRIFFSAPRDDTFEYVRRGESQKIEIMPPHTFRYSNDMESVSYRPYVHPGIVVDGQELDEQGKVRPHIYEQKTTDYLD